MFSITNNTLETNCILLKCLFLFSVPSSPIMTITIDKLSRNQLKQERKIDTQALRPLTPLSEPRPLLCQTVSHTAIPVQ